MRPRREMTDGGDLAQLREALFGTAAIDDPTERLLEVAAIIAEAFADLGVQPVVVGGLALAYWSDSAFLTGDIDVVMPRLPELSARLEVLGFEREGREWVLPGHDVAFEAPGETLEPGDTAEPAELPSGRQIMVLSLEDLLLWRLREWIHWRAVSGFHQAARLLVAEPLDAERLGRRAHEEGLTPALDELKRLTAEIEAGRAYENREISAVAERIAHASYSPESE